MFQTSNHTFLFSPLHSDAGNNLPAETKIDGRTNAESATYIEELQKVNEELWQARRAALNLMEDAILTKDQLQKSEERFRVLVSAITDSVYKMSADWKQMYNLDGKDFLADTSNTNKSWFEDYIPAGERNRVTNAIDEAIRTKSVFEMEHQVIDATGNIGWVYSRAVPIFNEGGEITEWIGAGSNITERKQAEETLRENNERKEFLLKLNDTIRELSDPAQIQYEAARLVAEQLQADRVHFAEVTEEEKLVIRRDYVRGNVPSIAGVTEVKAIAAALRLERDEPIVISDVEAFPLLTEEEKVALAAAKIRSQLSVALSKKGKKVASFAVDQMTRREWKPLEISILQEAAERTLMAVERAKAEQALRDSEARLQVAVGAAQLGTWVWHIAEDRSEPDAQAQAHFGLAPGDIHSLQEALERDLHPDDGPQYAAAVAQAMDPAGPGTLHTEFRIRRPDGQERWMAVHAVTAFEGTPPMAVRMIGVVADVTEQKQQEEKQQYLLQLSDSLRAFSDPQELLQQALQIVGEYLGLDRVGYNEIDPDVTEYWYRANYVREGFASVVGRYPMGPFQETVKNLQEGITFICNDAYDDSFTEAEKEVYRSINVGAYVTVPLVKGGRWVGNVVAHYSKPRDWKAQEISILEETAERIWAAVERATAEEALRKSEKQLASELADVKQLQKISSKIIAVVEEEEDLYEAIVNAAMEIMHADFARLQVFKPKGNHLMLFAWKAFDPASKEYWKYTKVNATANRQALQRKERVIVPNIDDSPEINTGELEEYHRAGIVSAQSTPLITRSGKVVGIISTQWRKVHQPSEHDLTLFDVLTRQTADLIERRQAEEALHFSEERFRTLTNSVPQLIWTNTAGGEANYFNQRWYEYSGLTYEGSAGLGWQVFVHPDDAPASVEKWKKALAAGEIFDTEYRLRRHDGKYRWFIGRNVPLKDDAGKVTAWFGSATDIEYLKNTEEALSQSEERLRITMESATDYAIITMNTERRVERWSKGAEEIFGYTEEEMIGQSADIIFTEEDRKAGAQQGEMEMARDTGRAADERWHQRKDDSRFFASGVMRPIQSNQLTGYVKVLRDTTQQQLFTEELHRLVAGRTVELQRSNEDLQQFAHVASHDLKEPIRKIQTFNNRIQDEYADALPPKVKTYSQKIGTAADRMVSMIEGVLRYSKLGNAEQVREVVDLNEMVPQITSDLEVLVNQKEAVITTTGLPTLMANPTLMYQLFYNLILNSLKFSKEGEPSRINLASEKVKQEEKDFDKITISDNGIGFEPEFSQEIFKTFTRLHPADEYEGNGLGLALCKKIVERHGGAISASGEPGKGATFTILLPHS